MPFWWNRQTLRKGSRRGACVMQRGRVASTQLHELQGLHTAFGPVHESSDNNDTTPAPPLPNTGNDTPVPPLLCWRGAPGTSSAKHGHPMLRQSATFCCLPSSSLPTQTTTKLRSRAQALQACSCPFCVAAQVMQLHTWPTCHLFAPCESGNDSVFLHTTTTARSPRCPWIGAARTGPSHGNTQPAHHRAVRSCCTRRKG